MYEYLRYTVHLQQEESTLSPIVYEVNSDTSAGRFLKDVCNLHQKASEEFIVIAADTKCKVIGWHRASIGNLQATIIHPREIFKFALLANAANLIVGHNHISGELKPSKEDVEITLRLKECGDLLGIPILDHLIIGSNGEQFSFRKEDVLT